MKRLKMKNTFFICLPALILLCAVVLSPAYSQASQTDNHKAIIYYFHGNYRCPSCRTLERLSRDAVFDNFRKELSAGLLTYKSVNVDEPQYAHFIDDFDLFTKSLVLVEERDGKVVHYKNLGRIWVLIRDENAFKEYVKNEVASFIKKAKTETARGSVR